MDNSFLRLVKDFDTARINENFLSVKIVDNRFIQMLPNETFLQISNSKEDIAFGGNVTIDLIDCSGLVVRNLVLNQDIFINEFTNTVTGIKNIAFEFGMLGTDYGGQLLYLRFSQPMVSGNVWYSAPFLHTYYKPQETTRFEYKNQSYFNGIAYDIANLYQSIRVVCYDWDRDWTVKNEGYTELSGDAVSYRQINTKITKGLFKYCNIFTLDRLVSMFSHNILYINGYKCNNKPNFKKGEMLGTSNFFQLAYDYNASEQFGDFRFQLFQEFNVIAKVPEGLYTLGTYNTATATSTLFSLEFNKPFTIASDIELKVFKDNVLFATFDSSKFSIAGQTLNIDVSASPITDNAVYSNVIASGKIISGSELFSGFALGDWEFSLQNGDWLNTDWNNSDFLTN